MNLTKKDYERILKHYGKDVIYSVNPKTKRRVYNREKTRKLTRDILAEKLCKCIKKVQRSKGFKLKEPAAIAICTKSIFKKRSLKLHRFKCKSGEKLLKNKKTNKYINKTRKKVF